MTDIAVLAVIFMKHEAMDCYPYSGLWHQFGACWKERTDGDKLVASIFPVMWLVYILAMDDYYKWWILWGLALLQFLGAGYEAFEAWRRGRDRTDGSSHGVVMRWGLAGHV